MGKVREIVKVVGSWGTFPTYHGGYSVVWVADIKVTKEIFHSLHGMPPTHLQQRCVVLALPCRYEKELQERQRKRAFEEEKQAEIQKSPEFKKRNLKDVYVEHKDEESGMTYWYNNETGESTWVDPFK